MTPPSPARVLWHDDLGPRPGEERTGGDSLREADIVIVGAGFTGLWTAYHLLVEQPGLRVIVFEADRVGAGASGRNGGWCTPELPLSLDTVDERHGPGAAHRWRTALVDTVATVRAILDTEQIDAQWADGGWLQWCRNAAQRERVEHTVAMFRRHGFGPEALTWMEPEEAASIARATSVVGASFSSQTTALHPARLVHGLADAVRRRGGLIVERCRVRELQPHGVLTDVGRIAARWVVRATEGYSARLAASRRSVIPVYSMMIATEPLDDATWERIGLSDRTVFNDARHTVIYGQRTADGRLAFGGRGAPYHYGSRIAARFDTHAPTRQHLIDTLVDLFPPLSGVTITHHWGGPLGVARDWHPCVGLDTGRGWAWAGGYVGEGVTASALAGRTLADLLTDRASARTDLPWVGHRSRRWEPEPLRWLGINAMVQIARYADRCDDRARPLPRPVGAVFDRLTGH